MAEQKNPALSVSWWDVDDPDEKGPQSEVVECTVDVASGCFTLHNLANGADLTIDIPPLLMAIAERWLA